MGTDDLYSPELPEPIIQRIQSLLPRKKSAETTLLSKSWDTAWSTRPTIDLDESLFPRNLSPSSFDHHSSSSYGDIDGLVKYAKKTFRRYEQSNIKINTFRLCVNKDWYGHSGLASKWTLKALKLGATDFVFRLDPKIYFPLPELFVSQNVVRLGLKNTFVDLPTVLRCRGLKSLTLSHVYMSSDVLFDIFSCCPLIENLSLSHGDNYYCYEVDDEHEKLGLKKLRSLVMCLLEYQTQEMLLRGLSSKFPNLKELTLKLRSCRGVDREILVISSHSLEIINYSDGSDNMQRVEFDVPWIRKFTFEGENIPKLSFRSTMDQWESRVSLTLTCDDDDRISAKWFFELSRFLTKLRLSKIHLCLHLHKRDRPQWETSNRENNDYKEGEIEGLYPHQVEDVTINNKCLPSLGFNALLDGLFRICRPKMISQYVSTRDDIDDEMPDDDNMWSDYRSNNYTIKKDIGGWNTRDNDTFLCTALEQVMKVTSLPLPTNFRHGLTDLDEVIAQKLIDEVWKPQPVGSILDDSTSEQRRFRFLFKWKPSLIQYNSDDDYDDDEDNDILKCMKIILK